MIDPNKIHILGINVVKWSIDISDTYLAKPSPIEEINLSLGKEIAHDFEEKLARFRLDFACDALSGDTTKLGLSADINIEFLFKVENLDDFIDEATERIDATIGSTLISIAYSTARGIVFEMTKNTPFKGLILPVIDPLQLLMEDNNGG